MKNYISDLSFFNTHLDQVAVSSAEGGKEYDITIGVGSQAIKIPFNADSYERLSRFIKDEIEEANELGYEKGGKIVADFSADTDSWFDLVSEKSDELKDNKNVKEAIVITDKEATRGNLEKLRNVIKDIPYSAAVKKSIDSQIGKILDGKYREFRFSFGGKRQGYGRVSAASEFFSMFEQAATYGSSMEKGGKTKSEILGYIVFRSVTLYLNNEGGWTKDKDNAKVFKTEEEARSAGHDTKYSTGVEVLYKKSEGSSMEKGGKLHKSEEIKKRLEYLRKELRAERISYGELAELQSLAKYIEPSDVELLEAAGVPEKFNKGGIVELLNKKIKLW